MGWGTISQSAEGARDIENSKVEIRSPLMEWLWAEDKYQIREPKTECTGS